MADEPLNAQIINLIAGRHDPIVITILCSTLIVFSYIVYKQNAATLDKLLNDGLNQHSNYLAKLGVLLIAVVGLPSLINPSSELILQIILALGIIYAFDKTIEYVLKQDPG